MRKMQIQFPNYSAWCVFPDYREELPQAIRELNLKAGQPVIVLIGGFIQDQHAEVTRKAMELIAAFAEENSTLVICGGTEVGIMGLIGQVRLAKGYRFPLLGITLENLATWPNTPRSKGFLWWRKERWPLAIGYSHFILVPGDHFGEDSPWIAEAATYLSKGNRSVTILANGGNVARRDIKLSLENDRSVIVLAGTGRLADEMAQQPEKSTLVTITQAEDSNALTQILQRQLKGE